MAASVLYAYLLISGGSAGDPFLLPGAFFALYMYLFSTERRITQEADISNQVLVCAFR